MSAEPQLPAEWSQEGGDPILSAGMSIAMQWRHLGTDKLEAALKALEPELRRQHKTVLIRLGIQREAADRKERERRSELEVREHRKRRAHVRHMADLTVGAVVALAMLGAGVYVAADAWCQATLLCGPSLLALMKIFVLRRSDPDDMKVLAGAARTSTNAAQQARPTPPAM
ncbi:hypothetical protein [Streptomyces mirabilis]|uniref:hypothetical protein n=1 Tax=Streptomyces mirabilis TaxID=68239 RepID=UPI00344629C9